MSMGAQTPIDMLLSTVEFRCLICKTPMSQGCTCFSVVLACPVCKKQKETSRHRSWPSQTMRVVYPCAEHVRHDSEILFFDADGREIGFDDGAGARASPKRAPSGPVER